MAQSSRTNRSQSSEDTAKKIRCTYDAFASKMYEWEKYYYSASIENFEGGESSTELEKKGRKILELIFQEFVCPGGRNDDRLANMLSSMHPEYDPLTEIVGDVILDKKGGSIIVHKTKGLKGAFKLVFIAIGDDFKIQKRYAEVSEGKWMLTHV